MRSFAIEVFVRILFLSGLTAAAACSSGVAADEYGTPYASYEIKGKVTDDIGNPVKGIHVSCESLSPDAAVQTAQDGTFVISGKAFPMPAVELRCNDIDEDGNGGHFAEKTVTVETVHVQKGEGNWNFGSFSAEVTIRLDKE